MVGIDWIEVTLRLCDDAGRVSDVWVEDTPEPVTPETYLERASRISGKPLNGVWKDGWTCTGHAHYNGPYGPLHITCTSPAHT